VRRKDKGLEGIEDVDNVVGGTFKMLKVVQVDQTTTGKLIADTRGTKL